MALSIKFVFVICFAAALDVTMGATSTVPPMAVDTTQLQQQQEIVSDGTPLSTSDMATAEPETPSTTTIAATTTAATTTAATTTTVTTEAAPMLQPPYSCFDCNSGSPLPGFWRNSNCNESGYVASWYVPRPCSTFCFSSVGLYPAGSVFRGCGEALHLPGRVLEDGCFEDVANHRYVCLCSGDHCNTHDLTLLSLSYAQEYVDMKRAEDDSESNSVH